jgi:hypothetical protein
LDFLGVRRGCTPEPDLVIAGPGFTGDAAGYQLRRKVFRALGRKELPMQTFSDHPLTAPELTDPASAGIVPDDPSIVEAEEIPEDIQVPEGVAEADYLEQILPA